MSEKKKPIVRLTGENGNAFLILGKVSNTLEAAGMKEEAEAFMKEATKGDYDHLLRTACEYVNVR
jgi:hypothetical protein